MGAIGGMDITEFDFDCTDGGVDCVCGVSVFNVVFNLGVTTMEKYELSPAHDLRLLIDMYLEGYDSNRDLLSEMRALVYGYGW